MKHVKPITRSSVSALKPGDEIRDPALKGFGARYRGKTITYFVHTRIHRRQHWITIGTDGSPWTPDTARKHATKIIYAAKTGADPRTFKDIDITLTFETVFNRYIAAREPHLAPSTAAEYRRMAAKVLIPYFKQKPFGSITREDMTHFHRSMASRPGAANHNLCMAKQVFFWAEKEGLAPDLKNPCLNIKFYKRNSRAQFLSIEDLGRLSEAFRWALSRAEVTPAQLSAILFLMFTGARRGEAFSLQRSFVDRHRMLAHLPTSKTGAKVLHLNAHAMAVLDGIPEVEGNPYYFVGRFPGTCISEIRKPWDKIRKRAQLEKFRLHDFRHSFASFAADGGATAQTVGAVLGHASIETTKIYMHLFANRAKETTTDTADRLHAIISATPAITDQASRKQRLRLTFLRRRPFLPRQQPSV